MALTKAQKELTIVVLTYDKMMKMRVPPMRKLLDSLVKINKDDFKVIIIDTTYPPDTSVYDILNKTIEKYSKKFPIMYVTISDLCSVHQCLENIGMDAMISKVNLKPYANPRNFGLILAKVLKSKLVLFLDDDEIILDKKFLDKVRQGILVNQPPKNKVYGKTGYYLNKGKTPYLPKVKHDHKKMWPSIEKINSVMYSIITAKKRFTEAKIAFGGIMVIHDKLYSKVPFDPYIPRGEDTDYLLNAMQFKMRFVADNQMKIGHFPPSWILKGSASKSNFYARFKQDMARFVYEREKLELFNNVDLDKLEPYPAIFLKEDLEYRAVFTCLSYATRNLKKGLKKLYKEHMKNIRFLFRDAATYAELRAPRYFRFQKRWVKAMNIFGKDKELYKHFNRF